jgi:triosephosphate isomerase (TIM)
MRQPIIVGNWKMHKTIAEAVTLVQALASAVAGIHDVDIGVAPPFTALQAVAEALRGSQIDVVGQNMHWEAQGAYTGETSPGMLIEAGCRRVIIGHSERRQYFAETDETVNRKLRAALGVHLAPIVCIGETLVQRDSNATFQVLDQQIRRGLEGLGTEAMQHLVIAYEPIWAIGTGQTATPAQAQEVHAFIRDLVGKLQGKALAEALRIQYGGSVNARNIQALMMQPDVDGALVGGASLEASSFAQIVAFQRR